MNKFDLFIWISTIPNIATASLKILKITAGGNLEPFFFTRRPHCNNLYKASRNFRKKFADKVEFIDIPIVFRGQDDSPLRLYYVAKKIGKGDLIIDELFKASFAHNVNVFDPGITNYLARSLGIHKEFQKEKDQKWVNQLIKDGERKASIYGLTGTPTIVIQYALKMDIGPYGTMAGFVKKIPETIADLTQ